MPYPSDPRLADLILENYQGSIILVDAAGTILYANQYGLNLCGRDKADFVGKTVYQMMEEGVFSNSSLADCLRSQTIEINYLYLENNPDKGIMALAVPCFDKNGAVTHAVAFSQPVRFAYEYYAKVEEEKRLRLSLIGFLAGPAEDYIAQAPNMKELFEMARKVSDMDATVLVTGESGTGKEVLARFIHSHSKRSDQILLPVNCASIPAELVESEFFGYDKGAFTGASKDGKPGLFELADKGTLFLDEIGELPMSMQSKLLRALESGEFKRVGGSKVLKTDVRIVAATNRDLPAMVQENRFREDLYYRLNVLPLAIPALRERVEDIEPLMRMFLARFTKKYNRFANIDAAMIDACRRYSWPGNVRELRNLIERYVITGAYYFSPAGQTAPKEADTTQLLKTHKDPDTPLPSYKAFMDQAEREYLQAMLQKSAGDVAGMAGEMGIHVSGVYRKLEKHGLDKKPFRSPSEG